LKRDLEAALGAPTRVPLSRRGLQRWAFVACLVCASIGLAPAGSNAGGRFGLTSHTVLGIYQSMPKAAARVCKTQVEAGRAAIMRAALSHDTKLVAGSEWEPTKMPRRETARAASAAGGTVYQGVNRPTPASGTVTRGIATWYGGVDGFDLGDGMADGSPFNPDDPTIAAGNHWPLGTWLMVCHGERCIPVCVRDRGGFGHAVDLSRAAFAQLAPLSSGVIDVTIEASP
jgi:rare lipoprotein A